MKSLQQQAVCKAASPLKLHAAESCFPGDVHVRGDERVWNANMRVYGAQKVWRQIDREGLCIARCTVERLMKRLGLQGVRRGKVVRTTMSDAKLPCPLDRVNRVFKADRPNQLWVSDFT
jgi:transposase InsO family protein